MKTYALLALFLANSQFVSAAIYGPDNRIDINLVSSLRDLSTGVGASIPKNFLVQNADKTYTITDVELAAGSSKADLCADERFGDQPTVSNCTGFMVGDRYLVTAGHCVLPNGIVDNDEQNPFCESFSWYLDFNLKKNGKAITENIPENRIYHCKKMIRAENFELPNLPEALKYGNDFAVIELDRPVASDIKIFSIAKKPPAKMEQVFTVGHPTGLPAKFSGIAPVLSFTTPRYFEVALDTQGGNSGGPVFNMRKEIVGILVSGHPIDYYQDPKGCMRANKCDALGKKCNQQAYFENLQTTNYVQYISEAMKWVPKSTSGLARPRPSSASY